MDLYQLRLSVGAVAEKIRRFSQQDSPSYYLPSGPTLTTRSKSSTPQPQTLQPQSSETIVEEEVRSCDIMCNDINVVISTYANILS